MQTFVSVAKVTKLMVVSFYERLRRGFIKPAKKIVLSVLVLFLLKSDYCSLKIAKFIA